MGRILTIDGGGIKGVMPAAFLAAVEEATGRPVTDYFDLIAGTSTGGIIALGLGLGMPAADLVRFYEELGPAVFGGSRLWRIVRRAGVSAYTSGPLRAALEEKFGDRRLGESRSRLVIPSVNLETGEVYIYKTAHHPRFERDYWEWRLSRARRLRRPPTYFPTHRSAAGLPLIDGGMWANNPTGLATVEAIGVLGWERTSLRSLALAVPRSPRMPRAAIRFSLGWSYWAWKSVEVFMAAQSSASLGTAAILVGHENVLRICPVSGRRRFGLDKVSEIGSLKGLGDSEARKALPKLRDMFLADPVEVFEPYRR
ncbi:MAG: patatin-like phospholipase family protein [Vicinamibacteria bacterium]